MLQRPVSSDIAIDSAHRDRAVSVKGVVTQIDADFTVHVRRTSNRSDCRVRLAGLLFPKPIAQRALKRLRQMANGSEVSFVLERRNANIFWAYLYVWTPRQLGRINDDLVAEGLAIPAPRFKGMYQDALETARYKKLGIWKKSPLMLSILRGPMVTGILNQSQLIQGGECKPSLPYFTASITTAVP